MLRGAGLASALLAGLAQPAAARDSRPGTIQVHEGTLASALREIATSTNTEIVSLEPDLARQKVSAQTLHGSARGALNALLRSTPFRAVWLGNGSFRIERRPARRQSNVPAKARVAAIMPDAEGIIVEGKFPTQLKNYPGSLGRIPFEAGNGTLAQPTDLESIAKRLPIVSGTAFGEGRDKIFVRGIADSSFNGASQPTTGVYFADALIGFGSPNPNLKLYDVQSVEILEGPQGTLYGAGSIGGVIRITPNPVNLNTPSVSVLAGGSLTAGGGPGWKAAGTVNLPIVADQVGARLVAYTDRQGGFIDDPRFGANINTVAVSGGRLAITASLPNAFTLEAGALFQSTRASDAQYADATGPMQRSARIPQPFSSEMALGRLSLLKRWDSGLTLTSVVSIGHRSAFDRFDATGGQAKDTAYDLQRSSTMFANETRLAQASSRITWVAGVSAGQVKDGQSRALGKPDDVNPLDEVTNITRSGSLFAQARVKLSDPLEATVGLRFTMARTDSQPNRGKVASFIKGGLNHHFDPTLALLWHALPQLSVYGRFQTSFRNGGVTVARGVGKVADFHSDSIVMGEAGFRLAPAGKSGLSLSGAISSARWTDVLAELVTQRGIPITSNIGNARITTVEASIDWTSRAGLNLGAGFLYTANHLVGDLAMQSDPRKRLLPDVPSFSANARASYSWSSRASTRFTLSADGRFVGRSVLGPGALFDLDQGHYAVVDLRALAQHGPLSLALSVDNFLNSRANRFALGNPLTLYRRDGFVPLRPRTVTLVAGVAW